MASFLADLTPIRKHRDFRRLWLGQSVSNIGNQLTVVGVSYQTYVLTHSTLLVGMIGLVQLAPSLLGSLWGGALVDAKDRRTVLLASQVALAAASAGLLLNTILGHPTLTPLFVCVAASAGFQAVNMPSRSAIVAQIVPREDLASASALTGMMSQLALIVGPAIAGVLIAAVGLQSLYEIDTASFTAVLLTALLLPRLRPGGGGTPFGYRSVVEGLRYAKRNRFLISLIVVDLSSMLFGMPKAVFPALALRVYHGGPGTVGLLYSAPGIGALVASVCSGWVRHIRFRGRAVAICMIVWGVAITLLGFIPVLVAGVVLLAVAGGADQTGVVFRQTIWQATVPIRFQGRLGGVFYGSAVSANSLGAGESGFAAAIAGPTFAVWSGGLLCLIGVAVVAWRYPEMWKSTGHDLIDFEEDGSPAAFIDPAKPSFGAT